MDRRLALAALLALAPATALAPRALASGGEKKKGGGISYIQIQTLTAASDILEGLLTGTYGQSLADQDVHLLSKALEADTNRVTDDIVDETTGVGVN